MTKGENRNEEGSMMGKGRINTDGQGGKLRAQGS
jgi:hypothetical protein